jgi:hypothetical protein
MFLDPHLTTYHSEYKCLDSRWWPRGKLDTQIPNSLWYPNYIKVNTIEWLFLRGKTREPWRMCLTNLHYRLYLIATPKRPTNIGQLECNDSPNYFIMCSSCLCLRASHHLPILFVTCPFLFVCQPGPPAFCARRNELTPRTLSTTKPLQRYNLLLLHIESLMANWTCKIP